MPSEWNGTQWGAVDHWGIFPAQTMAPGTEISRTPGRADGIHKSGPRTEDCGWCGVSSPLGAKRCGRCQWMFYCSEECARAHWKNHKKTCRPPKLQVAIFDKRPASRGRSRGMCSVDHKGEPFYLYRTQFESKVDEQTPPWHLFVDIDAPLVVSAALMLGVFSDRCPPPTPEDPRPVMQKFNAIVDKFPWEFRPLAVAAHHQEAFRAHWALERELHCLLYTSPSPRDGLLSRMPSSA